MGKLDIEISSGGVSRRAPSADMISGFMMGMGAVAPTGLAVNTTSDKLKKIQDAEALGITAAYDTTNNVLVHHHIREFFRKNSSGECFIRLATQGTTLTEMCDKNNPHLIQMIIDAKGKIRQASAVLNPAIGYAPTLSGGMDEDVLTAITKAQETAEECLAKKRPFLAIIEGRQFNGTIGAATDLRTLDSEYVHCFIGQDPTVAASHAIHTGYAAVGALMGMVSFIKVNENPGWTGKCNFTDLSNQLYLEAGLSNNQLSSIYEDDYDTLTEKGYGYFREYPETDDQQAGVYVDDFPVCSLLTNDIISGEHARVIHKAARGVYSKIFPSINAPFLLDPTTGTLDFDVAKTLEANANVPLKTMSTNKEVSGYDAFVDETRDVKNDGIEIEIMVVEVHTGRELRVKIGYTDKIN